MLARLITALLFTASLAVSLAGCAVMQAHDRLARLDSTVKSYTKALRWGHFDTASGFLQPRHTSPSPVDARRLEDIRVTSYEILNQVIRDDNEEAVIVVQFSFYHASTGSVHTIEDEQLWWYDAERNTWRLDGQLPDFTFARSRASRR